MKRSLLLTTCLLLSLPFVQKVAAQIAINPTTWSGSGATTGAGASNFSVRPGSTAPGSGNVNISQWQRGSGIAFNASAASYNSNTWSSATTLAGAQAANSYVYFTVTNNSTHELEISNIFIQSQVSATGPSMVQMQYCTGASGDMNLGSSYTVTSFASAISWNFTPAANIHMCANQVDTFKLYGWNATSAAGTLRINDNTSISALYEVAVGSAATTNAPFCINGSTSLNLNGTGSNGVRTTSNPYIYSWVGPGGTFTSTNRNTGIGSPTTSSSGVYTFTVTDNWGCKSSTTVPVILSPSPATPTTTPSGTFVICSNDSVVFSAPTGYTYEWRTGAYPGTPIAGATNMTYTARTSNRYRVMITNSYGCSTIGTPPDTVIVNTAPVSTVTASGPLAFCAGNSVTLTCPFAAGNTYQWYDGTTPLTGATSNVLTANTSGNYHVVVTTTSTGCTATSAGFVVTEVALPVATTTGDTTFCMGGSILLSTSVSAGATGVLLQWKKNTVNIPGATATSYVATTTGNYTCFVTIPSSCSISTNGIDVTVFPIPNPVITFNGSVFKTGNYYTSYQWFVNTVTIPGATNYSVTARSNGSYRVMVTDTNGCSKLSNAYALNNLAVNNVNEVATAAIYPNPATDMLHIEATEASKIVISSMEGKVVLTAVDASDISVSSLADGMYLVMVYDNKGNRLLVEKLLKK